MFKRLLIGLISVLIAVATATQSAPSTLVLYDAEQQLVTVNKFNPQWLVYVNTGGKQSLKKPLKEPF